MNGEIVGIFYDFCWKIYDLKGIFYDLKGIFYDFCWKIYDLKGGKCSESILKKKTSIDKVYQNHYRW